MFTLFQAITRVKDLIKELETKESTNKETVQILKHEFVEHKTTYEKVRRRQLDDGFTCLYDQFRLIHKHRNGYCTFSVWTRTRILCKRFDACFLSRLSSFDQSN